MQKFRTFVLIMLMASTSICYATSYYFRTIDVKNGLADYFVRDIIRDSHGYIWISTINGLSRYDGYNFNNFMPVQFGAYGNDVHYVPKVYGGKMVRLDFHNSVLRVRSRHFMWMTGKICGW